MKTTIETTVLYAGNRAKKRAWVVNASCIEQLRAMASFGLIADDGTEADAFGEAKSIDALRSRCNALGFNLEC